MVGKELTDYTSSTGQYYYLTRVILCPPESHENTFFISVWPDLHQLLKNYSLAVKCSLLAILLKLFEWKLNFIVTDQRWVFDMKAILTTPTIMFEFNQPAASATASPNQLSPTVLAAAGLVDGCGDSNSCNGMGGSHSWYILLSLFLLDTRDSRRVGWKVIQNFPNGKTAVGFIHMRLLS